jgi:hypothetical protein
LYCCEEECKQFFFKKRPLQTISQNKHQLCKKKSFVKFCKCAKQNILDYLCFLIIHASSPIHLPRQSGVKHMQDFENESDNAVNVLPSHLNRTAGNFVMSYTYETLSTWTKELRLLKHAHMVSI